MRVLGLCKPFFFFCESDQGKKKRVNESENKVMPNGKKNCSMDRTGWARPKDRERERERERDAERDGEIQTGSTPEKIPPSSPPLPSSPPPSRVGCE